MLVGLRSRKQIEPFSLHQPTTLGEAISLHRQPGVNALLAGGIDLIDWLKHGNAIDRLIRLDGLPQLAAITGDQDRLSIGATATHAAITENPLIQSVLPHLSGLWKEIANPRVRFAGTVGGNVMACRSDYDALPALLALDAKATLDADPEPIQLDKIRGLVTSFVIQSPTALRLFADRSLRPAITIWLGMTVTAGQVTSMRIAIGMAHPTAVCVTLQPNVPISELGRHSAQIAEHVTRELPAPVSSGHASASYRRRMVGVLTRRILLQAGNTQ